MGAQQGLHNPSQTKAQVGIWSWASSMCSAGTQRRAQKEKCERVAVLLRVSAWTKSFESSVFFQGDQYNFTCTADSTCPPTCINQHEVGESPALGVLLVKWEWDNV